MPSVGGIKSVEDSARILARGSMEDAFFVADLTHVRRRISEFRCQLPRVRPYYAVKCNPDPGLLAAVASTGAGFDIASIDELAAIRPLLSADELATRVVYANPVKSAGHLSIASRSGVRLMTFDSIYELDKIASIAPNAQLLLRIAVEDRGSLIPLGAKFGASPRTASALLAAARARGLYVVGIAFHVGSGAQSVKPYLSALMTTRTIFDEAEAAGMPLRMLDIGGGFSGYDGETMVTFGELATAVSAALDALFPESVEVIAEPGRFIATGALSLAARIVGVRTRGGCRDYYIADGVHGSFKDAHLLDVSFQCRRLHSQAEDSEQEDCDVMATMRGPSNDPYDVVLRDVPMPELRLGDWVLFRNMGSYTVALSSKLGSIERPPVYYLD